MPAAAAAAGALPAAAGVADLLVGEYDNHEQVWPRPPHGGASVARVHWLFTRLDDGRIGVARGHGQTAPRQPAWMLRFDGDRATVLLADGRELACVYRWKKLSSDTPAAPTEAAFDAGYVGIAQDDEGCPAELPTRWELTRERLVATRGETLRARRVTRYAGWAALQRRRIDPDAADDDYVLLRDLALHDEGCIIPITDAGKPTGYAIELARLTYQDTRTAVLKLGVVDAAHLARGRLHHARRARQAAVELFRELA